MFSKTSLKLVGLALGVILTAGCQHQSTLKAESAAEQAQSQAEQKIITVHLAQQKPDPKLVVMEFGEDNKLYALAQPVLNQNDIEKITAVAAPDGRTFILIEMNPAGRTKLTAITNQATGAFLLTSAGEQLINVSKINGEISDGKLLISTNDEEHSQLLLNMLR
ncbi:MAG TPA: hypothetical protein VJY83_08620 [Thiopseudomonas sp.]|nr:hypothetical protein [Thiopseudomonas sp.]